MTENKKTLGQRSLNVMHMLLGTKAIKKSLNVEPVANGLTLIKDYKDNIIKATKQEGNHKSKTFEEAMAKHGYTDEMLIQNYKNCVFSTYIAYFAVLASLVSVFYFAFVAKALLGVITSIGVMAPFTAMFMKFSFMAYCIRHRKLHCFKEYLSRPKEWFPTVPTKKNK